jgi:hypothetical protein
MPNESLKNLIYDLKLAAQRKNKKNEAASETAS